MPPLSIDSVIDTCLRTMFVEEPSLGFFFTSDGVLLLLPTTRRIAGRLGMPHYYVLPPAGVLEAEGNLTRAERVGIRTTPGGRAGSSTGPTRYRADAGALLGPDLYALLVERAG